MDLNPPSHAEERELDLEGYPAEQGRSLVGVAAIGVADRLSRVRTVSLPAMTGLPLWGLVAIGLALGSGMGLVLVSS